MTTRLWEMIAMGAAPPFLGTVGLAVAQAATPDGLPWWVNLILGPLGVLGMFIVIVHTGRNGDWVWGRENRETVARFEKLLATAEANNQRLIDVSFKMIERQGQTGEGR